MSSDRGSYAGQRCTIGLMHPNNTEHDCNTCPIASSTRRDFVRDAAAIGVAGVLATLGISRTAAALPVSMIEALSRSKETLSYAIPPNDVVQIDKENDIILVRWQNNVYAF